MATNLRTNDPPGLPSLISLGYFTSMEFLKRTNSTKKQICGNLEIWLILLKSVPCFTLVGFPCAAEDLVAEEEGRCEMHVLEDAGHWICFFCML